MATNAERIASVGLRSCTLVARFFLIFLLAKHLTPTEVGYFGLFAAASGYALYLVGLDFYTYVTREILRAPYDERARMLKGQAALSGCLYLAMMPLGLLFLHKSQWPDHLAWWFLPILVLEQLNQELFRILVVLSQQLMASIILFVRQGSWVLALAAIMHWEAESRRLGVVMVLWAVAGGIAAVLGVWRVRKLHVGGWTLPVNWVWVRKGIAVSLAFLLATLALRGIQTLDRYWLGALGGIDMVGPYVLFMGVASALMVFLDAGVFAYAYPELIRYHRDHEDHKARAKVRRLYWQTAASAVVFSAVSLTLLPYLLRWIDKAAYRDAMGLYAWLLMAMVVNALSMIPHYALYARGHDRPIIYSHVAALLVFVMSAWALGGRYGALAIPIAINVAFGLILCWKVAAYWQLNRPKPPSASPPLQTA